ncbi:MAG: manganese efflux pump [Thermomicrobiales bacterium]
MDALVWFLIALPFAIDVFAGGLSFGVGGIEKSRWPLVAAGLALLSAVFIALGIVIGESLEGGFGTALKITAGLLLIVLGLRSILDSRRQAEAPGGEAKTLTQRSVVTKSAVLAVDNLAVGISFAVLGAPLGLITGIVFVQCFISSYIGLALGRRLGVRAGDFAAILAGLVFAALGGAILYQGLVSFRS